MRTISVAQTNVPCLPNYTNVRHHHQRKVWVRLFSYSNVRQETTTGVREPKARERERCVHAVDSRQSPKKGEGTSTATVSNKKEQREHTAT